MDVRRDYKITMENNPTEETVIATDVSETDTNTESGEQSDDSSSTQTDYEALIEAERKADPNKAKEAFKKRQEKRKEEIETHEEEEDVDDKPMTRREIEEYLARRTQEIVATANSERIQEIASTIADSEGEARFIMEIHKNRVFPEGMSIREQLEEAKAIATVKKVNAKNAELARKIASKETASKDTSAGIPQISSLEPKLSADLKGALRNAGFVYDNTTKLYLKTLPNGKRMFTDPKTGRKGML